MNIDQGEFRATLGHFASGVVVVTGMHREGPVGFTCQSFFSLSLDPPLVALAPGKSSTSWPRVAEAGTFCANILAPTRSRWPEPSPTPEPTSSPAWVGRRAPMALPDCTAHWRGSTVPWSPSTRRVTTTWWWPGSRPSTPAPGGRCCSIAAASAGSRPEAVQTTPSMGGWDHSSGRSPISLSAAPRRARNCRAVGGERWATRPAPGRPFSSRVSSIRGSSQASQSSRTATAQANWALSSSPAG